VSPDDGYELLLDEAGDGGEETRFLELVGVEALDQLLAGVEDDVAGQRQAAQAVEGARVELEGTLVLEFVEDVALDLVERALGVDEVVVEDLLERVCSLNTR